MTDEDIIQLLTKYDSSPIGSEERVSYGNEIDRIGSKIKPSHILRHIKNYLKSIGKEYNGNNTCG